MSRSLVPSLAALVVSLVAPSVADAAEPVHLHVKVNGVDVQGESTQTSLGRENSIECVAFSTELFRTPSNGGRFTIDGGRFTCRKRIDKANPKLVEALVTQAPVSVAARFFRPNPSGDGTTEQYYTLTGTAGRVVSIAIASPDATQAATSDSPAVEDVVFELGAVTFTYTNGGATAAWTATDRR